MYKNIMFLKFNMQSWWTISESVLLNKKKNVFVKKYFSLTTYQY